MKKIFILLCTIYLMCLTLNGCQDDQSGKKEVVKVKENNIAQEINIDKLLEYKDSYVGDNSAVGNIIYNSPGKSIKQFELKTTNMPYVITVDYGLIEGTKISKKDFEKYWNEGNTKKIFLNNATTLFILIKNVDEIKFNLEINNKVSFSISRKDLESFYNRDLREYSKNKDIWKKEVLEDTLNSKEKLNAFFEQHKINKN